ncbi:uncharacterized protein LOC124457296 [Xenia sp. Carnegie-2017]|uniref:uncharacterized protein LOC124457296 n=1 Tax=Xenia sp. Carnegie-2017 TaxID=2897299 RepID=UPI001F048B4D|nr:uncharacterized protein LOC124457296 [Xenia sp. Carnegie-2017]
MAVSKVENDQVHVDPQLLFQRLVFARNTVDDLEEVFQYELCSYPAALFDSPLTLRQPQKSNLADTLWEMLSPDAKAGPVGETKFVIDGGALLHRVPWPKKASYKELCQKYCHYVKQKYGAGSCIVFDGYDNPSTKNMAQQRRSSGKVGATVSFEADMKITMKTDVFLANIHNKKRLIPTLRNYLDLNGCTTLQADGDADLLIVKSAVSCHEISYRSCWR